MIMPGYDLGSGTGELWFKRNVKMGNRLKSFKQGSGITNLWWCLIFNIIGRREAKEEEKAEEEQSPEHMKKKNGYEDRERQ